MNPSDRGERHADLCWLVDGASPRWSRLGLLKQAVFEVWFHNKGAAGISIVSIVNFPPRRSDRDLVRSACADGTSEARP